MQTSEQQIMRSIAQVTHAPAVTERIAAADARKIAQINPDTRRTYIGGALPQTIGDYDARAAERNELDAQMQAFLARGGSVKKIATNKSGLSGDEKKALRAATKPEKEVV